MGDKKEFFQVKVNDFDFSFTKEEIEKLDFIQDSPFSFNLIKQHRSVSALVTDSNIPEKKFNIEIGGENFEVAIKNELDIKLDQMGFSAVSTKHVKEIKAPMPGLVLEIDVKEGQQVNEGDKLLILEAMKMENSIVIHTAATIKNIIVKAGQAVEKGQVLIELD